MTAALCPCSGACAWALDARTAPPLLVVAACRCSLLLLVLLVLLVVACCCLLLLLVVACCCLLLLLLWDVASVVATLRSLTHAPWLVAVKQSCAMGMSAVFLFCHGDHVSAGQTPPHLQASLRCQRAPVLGSTLS